MLVSATDLQNNFGKYLKLCKRENIIVTRNGKKQAVMLNYPRNSEGYEAGEPCRDYETSARSAEWVTYKQFMEMTEDNESRYELIDGEVYLMASPNHTHQKILGELYIFFRQACMHCDSCDTFMAPYDIRLIRQIILEERETTDDDINIVQPDLMILCDYEKDLDKKDKYQGIPKLVVEILSPTSRSKDNVKKLDLYMESGIEEFWIIDPEGSLIMVYSFKEYNLEKLRVYTAGQTAESICMPGLKVPVNSLF